VPPIEYEGLHQKSMLWRATGVDAYGQPTHESTPEEISVRWNTRRNHEMSPSGSVIKLDATAYVEEEIPIDSLMWLGDEEDWEDSYYGTGSGTAAEVEFKSDNKLHVVKTYKETPDVKGIEVRREVGLVRFKHDTTAQ
jgi:hypothetical protein